MHPSCKQSPCSEEPGRRCSEQGSTVRVLDSEGDMRESRKSGRNSWELQLEVRETDYRGLSLENWSFLYLFPVMEKQSLHPADGWLICTGGLLDAKTGYGVVEIRNSRDQNCQHGFQRFIFSMLSTACLFLFCQKASYSTPAHNGTKCFEHSEAFWELTHFLSDWCRWTLFVYTENHWND